MSFAAEVKSVFNNGWDAFTRSVEKFNESDGFQAYLYGVNDADQQIGRSVNTVLKPLQLISDGIVEGADKSGEWVAERYLRMTDAQHVASSHPGVTRFAQAQMIPGLGLDVEQVSALTSALRDTVGQLEFLARRELPAGSAAQQQMFRLVAASRTAVDNTVRTMGDESVWAAAAKNDLMAMLARLVREGENLFRRSSQSTQVLATGFFRTLDAVKTSFAQGRLHDSFVAVTRQTTSVLPQVAGHLQAWASSVRSAGMSASHPALKAGCVVGGALLGAGATFLLFRK